jgi:hypothetical protein
MIQRRAYEEVTIAHGDHAVTLRPSLRAATILEERYGLPTLFRALNEFNLTIISEIIRVCAVKQADAAAFLSLLRGRPLYPFFLSVLAPLTELVSMLTPAPDPKAKPSTGRPMTWLEIFAALYDRATGWLGWTPEQTWSATPTEIDRTYRAHVEKLKALNGINADDKEHRPDVDTEALSELINSDSLDPEFDRAGLHALKGRGKAA